jgi:hypothetical protein
MQLCPLLLLFCVFDALDGWMDTYRIREGKESRIHRLLWLYWPAVSEIETVTFMAMCAVTSLPA